MLHAVEDVPHRAVSIQSQLRAADATLEAVIADCRGAGDAKVRAICNGPAAGAQRNVLSTGEALHAPRLPDEMLQIDSFFRPFRCNKLSSPATLRFKVLPGFCPPSTEFRV